MKYNEHYQKDNQDNNIISQSAKQYKLLDKKRTDRSRYAVLNLSPDRQLNAIL